MHSVITAWGMALAAQLGMLLVGDGVGGPARAPQIRDGLPQPLLLECNSSQDVDNSGNSNTAAPSMSCATGDSVGVLWFGFVATAESVEIHTCDSLDGDDSVMALYEGDYDTHVTEIACSEDEDCGPEIWLSYICYGPTMQSPPLIIGDEYFIQLASWRESSRGIYQLDINCPCPDLAPSACCLPDGSCTIAAPIDCEQLDGVFQGAGTNCDDPGICGLGACCLPDGDCVHTSHTICENQYFSAEWNAGESCEPNPCAGACCTFFLGDFTCTVSSSSECTGTNDDFWAGEACDAPLFECPDHRVCEAIRDDDASCQIIDAENWPAGVVGSSSDANPQSGNGLGVTRADDFTPSGGSISQVCWWGYYLDAASPMPPPPPQELDDDFTVTYYDSDPATVCPRNVVASFNQGTGRLTVTRTPTGERVLPHVHYPAGHQVWIYSATHAEVSVVPGDCYWIEIVNNTDDGTGQQTRGWYWSTVPFGQANGFSLSKNGQPATSYDCPAGDFWYLDQAFCLDTEIEPCTRCEDVCASATVQEGEPTCYDGYVDTFNIGCSALEPPEPPVMTELNCGDVVCGKTGSYACDQECLTEEDCPAGESCLTGGLCSGGPYQCLDVDWYRFNLDVTTQVEVSITADFPYAAEMKNPFGADICRPNLGQVLLLEGPACHENASSQYLAAGVYYLVVEPQFWLFPGLTCDEYEYVVEADCAPPACQAQLVESCRFHGAAGRLCLDLAAGTEPRGSVSELDVTVDTAAGFFGGVTVDCGAISWTGTVGSSVNGSTVTLSFDPGLPNRSACIIEMDCGASFCVQSLTGDVDRNGIVTTADASAVKTWFGASAAFNSETIAADLDLNGTVTTADNSVTKALFGHLAPTCP